MKEKSKKSDKILELRKRATERAKIIEELKDASLKASMLKLKAIFGEKS